MGAGSVNRMFNHPVAVQILAIDKRLHPLTVVHVWDGTDLPPVSE